MNIRDIALNVGIACLAVMAFNYFFPVSKSSLEGPVGTFTVSKENEAQRPLNSEIDFTATKRPQQDIITEIDTQWATLSFATEGASLDSLEYKHPYDTKGALFRAIFPKNEAEKEERCFVVGLDEETPYFYELKEFIDGEDIATLVYTAESNQAMIKKSFVVHKTQCVIEVKLSISPKKEGITPRIFFPAPVLPELGQQDGLAGIVMTSGEQFEKIEYANIPELKGWVRPTLFGLENKYFIHALIKDSQEFVNRAFYGLKGKRRLVSVLEGSAMHDAKEWNLTFFFGPKDSDFIDVVDTRLEKTLDYAGIFAPISKVMLKLLKLLYQYVHNFGLAIMVLILCINILLLPLSLRGKKRMKEQQEMQRKLAYIQQRYKNDPERLNFERMELIKKHGMPGLGGCLPLLLQMPLFIAFSRVLGNSIVLYQAPMLWIHDLSASDPYYVLPFIVMVTMLLNALSVEPQQRISLIVMAFVFGAITAKLSAGLALYFALNTLLGVVQTRIAPLIKA